MDAKKINSKKIKGANPETQYYPNAQIIAKHDKVINPQVSDPKNIMHNIQAGVSMKPKGKLVAGKAVKTVNKAQKKLMKSAKQAKKEAKKPAKKEDAKKPTKKETKKEKKAREADGEESFIEIEDVRKNTNVDNPIY